jgi:hypothetical protein
LVIEGELVQKEELIHLHTLMIQIKNYFEHTTGEQIAIEKYRALNISPVHVFKRKLDHEKALFELGNEILASVHRPDAHVRNIRPINK